MLATAKQGLSRAGRRWVGSLPELGPPDSTRLLRAHRRDAARLGTNHADALRRKGHIPAALIGDRLPFEHLWVDHDDVMPVLRRAHFQRELLTLKVEGGETVRVLPQEVQFDTEQAYNVKHVNFRRWPRDPQRHPVKLKVPLLFTDEDTVDTVKAGGYVFDMFTTGLPCKVRDPNHVPRFIHCDMRKAVGDDIRLEHLELPPGVSVRLTPRTKDPAKPGIGNFLVGRAKRIRG